MVDDALACRLFQLRGAESRGIPLFEMLSNIGLSNTSSITCLRAATRHISLSCPVPAPPLQSESAMVRAVGQYDIFFCLSVVVILISWCQR